MSTRSLTAQQIGNLTFAGLEPTQRTIPLRPNNLQAGAAFQHSLVYFPRMHLSPSEPASPKPKMHGVEGQSSGAWVSQQLGQSKARASLKERTVSGRGGSSQGTETAAIRRRLNQYKHWERGEELTLGCFLA